MIRTNVLMKLTRTLQCCCNRTNIPLCNPMCEPPTSPMNSSLLQWQLWQRHLPTPKSKLSCTEPRPYNQIMPDYTLSDLKRQKRRQEYLSCLPPAKTKKGHISLEMRTLLTRYAAEGTMRFKKDPLHVESGPLALYLNSVMQSDGFFNHIYNIDFYENNEPSYAALQRALEQQLNPFSIGDLFASLRAGVPLTPEQLQQLLDFLLALSHMSPEQLAAYMHQLLTMGLLTPDVLYHLQKLLAENPHLRNALNAAQLDMLTNALRKAGELAAKKSAQKLKEDMVRERARQGYITSSPSTMRTYNPRRSEKNSISLNMPGRKRPDAEATSMTSLRGHDPVPSGSNLSRFNTISMFASMSRFDFGGSGAKKVREEYVDYVDAIIHNTIPSSRRWPFIQPAMRDTKQTPKQMYIA